MVRAIQGHACNSPFSSGRRRRKLDYYAQGSLAAVLFIPPVVLRYSGSAVPTRPRWYPIAFASGVWISAVFAVTIVSDRLFFSPWWNVAALLYVYPYLGLSLHIVVRHGFRAKPSSIDRKKFRFLLVGGGIASLVAPLNFLPGTGIPFPPLGSVAVPLFFL